MGSFNVAHFVFFTSSTLTELSIVPHDFPCPMDSSIRDHKVRRVEEVEKTKWATLKERVGSLRTQLSFPQENLKEALEEEECEAMRQSWMKDFSQVFKEDLTIEDRIDMDPVKVKLVENHEEIKLFHPKTSNEIPASM